MPAKKSSTSAPPTQTDADAADRLDRRQAAAFLGVSASLLSVDVTTRRHGIPYFAIGRRVVYSRRRLREWMAAREVNVPTVAA